MTRWTKVAKSVTHHFDSVILLSASTGFHGVNGASDRNIIEVGVGHEQQQQPQDIDGASHIEHADHKLNGHTWNSKWWLGIFFIVLVSAIWAVSSILVQLITDDLDFNQPFVITYIGSLLFVGYIPSHLLMSSCGRVRNPPMLEPDDRSGVVYKELEDDDELSIPDVIASDRHSVTDTTSIECTNENDQLTPCGRNPSNASSCNNSVAVMESVVDGSSSPSVSRTPTHMFALKLGLFLAPVWFFAQWMYVSSLAKTSVTSSTIISNSSSLFTFAFSVMAGTEMFTPMKAAGVALVMAGAIAVGLGDRTGQDSLWGDVAALLSAALYGVYSTILRKIAPSDEEVAMSLVLGYMGAGNALLFLPVLVCIALAPGVLALQGLTLNLMKLVVVRALFDNVLSELLFARAILLTSATVATVGCSITIPIAFCTDFFRLGRYPGGLAAIGATFVVGGFVLVSRGESPTSPVLTDSGTCCADSESLRPACNRGRRGHLCCIRSNRCTSPA